MCARAEEKRGRSKCHPFFSFFFETQREQKKEKGHQQSFFIVADFGPFSFFSFAFLKEERENKKPKDDINGTGPGEALIFLLA